MNKEYAFQPHIRISLGAGGYSRPGTARTRIASEGWGHTLARRTGFPKRHGRRGGCSLRSRTTALRLGSVRVVRPGV